MGVRKDAMIGKESRIVLGLSSCRIARLAIAISICSVCVSVSALIMLYMMMNELKKHPHDLMVAKCETATRSVAVTITVDLVTDTGSAKKLAANPKTHKGSSSQINTAKADGGRAKSAAPATVPVARTKSVPTAGSLPSSAVVKTPARKASPARPRAVRNTVVLPTVPAKRSVALKTVGSSRGEPGAKRDGARRVRSTVKLPREVRKFLSIVRRFEPPEPGHFQFPSDESVQSRASVLLPKRQNRRGVELAPRLRAQSDRRAKRLQLEWEQWRPSCTPDWYGGTAGP